MGRYLLIGIFVCHGVAMSFAQNKLLTSFSNEMPFVHTMPYRLVGKLLFIKATIDEQTGWVLIDSGFPEIAVNESTFFYKRKIIGDRYLKDLTGATATMDYTIVTVQIEEMVRKKQSVVLMNLSKFKRKTDFPILGVLGYTFLKNIEIVIDPTSQTVTFFELTRKGKRKNKSAIHTASSQTILLKKYNHFLYLKATIGGQQLKVGVDLGAENNVVGTYKLKTIAPYFTIKKTVHLVSFHGKQKVPSGKLEKMRIQDMTFDLTDVLLLDLKQLYTIKGLDAIVGYNFLSQWKIAINYKQRTLSLWSLNNKHLTMQ